ncbi:MAG: hypothetical protein JW806_06500 [Sedimentisphaerales bacterium]|nr:hypothetical protein [Sedimentisphaerales bacterium]
MNNIEKRHFDAAGEMVDIFAGKLGENRAVHPETAIAAGARMAGTMLFRSFGFDTTTMLPGSAVLSNEANEKWPELVDIVASMLYQFDLPIDKKKLEKNSSQGEAPKLSVNEMQKLLEEDLTRIREKHGLDLVEGARSCALAVAFLIRECAPGIGLEVGFNIATCGFIEGLKTVPISQNLKPKQPWYRFWK